MVRDGSLGDWCTVQALFFNVQDNIRNRSRLAGLYDIGCYTPIVAGVLCSAELIAGWYLVDWDPVSDRLHRVTFALAPFDSHRSTQFTPYQRRPLAGHLPAAGNSVPFRSPANGVTRLPPTTAPLPAAGNL
jgi:hypothetical protein